MSTRKQQQAIRARAVVLAGRGMAPHRIAKALSRSVSWVYWACRDKTPRVSDADESKIETGADRTIAILAELKGGKSDARIARRFKVPVNDVRSIQAAAQRFGLLSRSARS